MNDKLKKKELGKGLEALIKTYSSSANSNPISNVPLDKIIPNKNNPRENFDEAELKELKDSIFKHGILQALTVRKIKGGKYELIAGGRRFEAIKMLYSEHKKEKFNSVPVFIKKIKSESQMTELALIENIQRSNLNPIEEAFAYSKLKINYNMNDQQIANSIGKSRSAVTNTIRLLNFLKHLKTGRIIIDALQKKIITAGHARPLLDLKPEARLKVFKKIIKNKLSVRMVEKEVGKYKKIKNTKIKNVNSNQMEDLDELISIYTTNLSKHFETRININTTKKGSGKIIIEFQDSDNLKDIIENKILK
tara:strand:+ start:107 stop:1027 length:921 start_codon:yes stop_codon:yes gene_type:complete